MDMSLGSINEELDVPIRQLDLIQNPLHATEAKRTRPVRPILVLQALCNSSFVLVFLKNRKSNWSYALKEDRGLVGSAFRLGWRLAVPVSPISYVQFNSYCSIMIFLTRVIADVRLNFNGPLLINGIKHAIRRTSNSVSYKNLKANPRFSLSSPFFSQPRTAMFGPFMLGLSLLGVTNAALGRVGDLRIANAIISPDGFDRS
jgi:hypothetical protein